MAIVACNDGQNPKDHGKERPVIIKNTSRLVSPRGLQKIALGDPMSIQISGNDIGIDSITISYQQKKLIQTVDSTITLNSRRLNATGDVRLVARVYLKNGKSEAFNPKFTIVPPSP
ncbi:MAG: hypothetical protein AAGJ93_04460, partial [Bacteroidota bacterium]